MERVFVGLLSGAAKESVLIIARSLLNFIYYTQFQQHGQNPGGYAGQPRPLSHT